MIKKMRRRVILAAMLAFSAVIIMIGILVNVVNYYVVTNKADETLEAIYDFECSVSEGLIEPGKAGYFGVNNRPLIPFMGLKDEESNYMTRFFVVRVGADEMTYSASIEYIATVDEENAFRYARKVIEENSYHGYLDDYRYLKIDTRTGYTVVFLNIAREKQAMKELLIMTGVISLISLLVVFALVVPFSRKAIKPFEKNINQQKRFITDASHELKTPLTSISTSVDVITMEHGEDEWTDNIRNQTSRMSKLVSELVTLSRLDEENPLPNKEQFSLSNAAWEIAEVIQPQAKAQEKDIEFDIEDNVDMVGEKESIQKMLSVLLDNAVRYSDEHGTIRFKLYRKHSKVCIEVFNTCNYSVPPDVNRLFDRFYRPDESRNSETGGNGVGLAIAKAVAEKHGGNICAICPDGKSMTIKIKIC